MPPIDPSIPLRANAFQQPVSDPLESFGKVVALRGLMLREQKSQRDSDREEALRKAFVFGPDGKLDELATGRNIAAIDPSFLEKFQHNRATEANARKEAEAKAVKAQLDRIEKANELQGSLGRFIGESPDKEAAYAQARQSITTSGMFPPEILAKMPPNYDPAFVRQMVVGAEKHTDWVARKRMEFEHTYPTHASQEGMQMDKEQTSRDAQLQGMEGQPAQPAPSMQDVLGPGQLAPNQLTATPGVPFNQLATPTGQPLPTQNPDDIEHLWNTQFADEPMDGSTRLPPSWARMQPAPGDISVPQQSNAPVVGSSVYNPPDPKWQNGVVPPVDVIERERRPSALAIARWTEINGKAPAGYSWTENGSLVKQKGFEDFEAQKVAETGRHNRATETNAAGNAAMESDKNRQTVINNIRDDFTKNMDVKNYRASKPLYEAAKRAPQTNAGDIQLLYSVGKILDPASVVREGELRLVGQAQTLMSKWASAIDAAVMGGGRLSPQVRGEITQMLEGMVKELKTNYTTARKPYEDNAKRLGLPINEVLSDDAIYDMKSLPDPAQHSGKTVEGSDGTRYKSDGSKWLRQ